MKKIRSKPMKHLKALREQHNLSQLAMGLEVGVSASSIQQYEAGTNSPSVKVLAKMADYFGVSMDYMYDRTEVRSLPDSEELLLVDRLKHVSDKVIQKAVMDILGRIIVE